MSEKIIPTSNLIACKGRYFVSSDEECWTEIPVDDKEKTIQELVDEHLKLPDPNENGSAPKLQIEFAFEMTGYPTIYWCFAHSSWWMCDESGDVEKLVEAAMDVSGLRETKVSVDFITGMTLDGIRSSGGHILRNAYDAVDRKRSNPAEDSADSGPYSVVEPFTPVDLYTSIVNRYKIPVSKNL